MQTKRMIWLDSLRLVAGVSMVGLHATSDATGQPFPLYEAADRWAPMLLRAVIYTARTELFLIISLFLLFMSLDKRPRSYGQTMIEQARRLLIPFVFWTVFFAFYNLLKSNAFGYQGHVWAQLASPWVWFEYLTLGTSKYHMHFIPTLFGLILLIPLYKIAVRHPWMGILICVALVIKRHVDGQIWSNYYDHEALPWLLRGVKILTYAGYGFVAASAYGLWRKSVHLNRFVPAIVALGLVLFAIKLMVTRDIVVTGEWQFGNVAGYWSDFLMPVVLFGLAMALSQKNWPSELSTMAKYSFGIYLCHPIFLDLVEIAIHAMSLSPMMQVFVKISVTLPLTVIFVIALSKTRMLAWTIGLGAIPFLSFWEKKRGTAHV